LWQVSEASDRLIFEAPEYDLAYVERRSLRLDLWILYRTARMWATRSSSPLRLAGVPRWAWRADPARVIDLTAAEDELVIDLASPNLALLDLEPARVPEPVG
jgi:hypothetical protein